MRKDVSLIQAHVALYTQSISSSKDEEFVKLFTNNYEKGGELKAKLLEISDGAKAEVELLETAYETIKDIQIKFDLSKLEENLIEPKYKELDDINHSLEEKGLEISDDNSLIQSLKYMNIEIKFLSEEQLEKYKDTEIGALLFRRFKVKRSITTYENLVNAQSNSTIKPSFHMWGSLSGRIISYNPSTQNLPKEYKDYILPLRQGESVYELDIKYAEVLGLANLADETVIFDLIKENVDIYNYTFASLFGKKIDAVTPEHRAIAKKIVNGINLGIGQSKLAEMINSSEIVKNEITTEQAKKIKETYLNLYPKIKDYAKGYREKAHLNNT